MRLTVRFVLALSLLCIATVPALGAEFAVRTAAELRAALLVCDANDQDNEITLAIGRYEGSFEFRSQLTRSLTIRAADGVERERVILDGRNAGRVLEFYTNPGFDDRRPFHFEIRGISIRNGDATNEDHKQGGGIRANLNGGSILIADCVIDHCRGVGDGGGLYLAASRGIRVERCLIADNSAVAVPGAEGRGGGLFMNVSSAYGGSVVGSVIVDNSAAHQGGGLWIGFQKTGTRNITSNTILGNSAPEGAGLYFYAAIIANVMNNIVRDNIPAPGGEIAFRDGYVPNRVGYNNVVNSVLGGWTESGGNVDVDPGFMNPAGDDFRLLGSSPLLDAGRNDAPGMINGDHAGAPRFLDNDYDGEPVVDIGAYERPAYRYGCIGTELVLVGIGFGELKPKAFLQFEAKPGKWKKSKLKVLTWADGRVVCLFKRTLPPGAYPIFCQPKGKGLVPIMVGEMVVNGPDLSSASPKQASRGVLVTLTGTYFGTKKPKVFLVDSVTGKKKKAKVKRIGMDARTGASELDFVVPKLAAGTYVLRLVNKVGETSSSYVVTD